MADDTASLKVCDLPKERTSLANLLNSDDGTEQEAEQDEAPAPARPEALPGRRPLFRN